MWVILADFDRLSVVVVVAVGMWATRLRCPSCPQRCYGVGERESSGERESLSQSGFALLAVVQDGRAVRQVLQLALLQGWQHASEDFEPQVVLVAQAVGAALDHPDLVVEALDEALLSG